MSRATLGLASLAAAFLAGCGGEAEPDVYAGLTRDEAEKYATAMLDELDDDARPGQRTFRFDRFRRVGASKDRAPDALTNAWAIEYVDKEDSRNGFCVFVWNDAGDVRDELHAAC